MACSTSLPTKGFITMARTPSRITISRSRSSAEQDRTITGRFGLVQRMWVRQRKRIAAGMQGKQKKIRRIGLFQAIEQMPALLKRD